MIPFNGTAIRIRIYIYVVNRDGTGLTRLTDDELSEADPAWSPDGGHIAFVASTDPRGHDGNIFITKVDGSDRQQLTGDATDKQQPVWSPDGSRIAFQSYTNDSWGLYVLNAAEGTVALLTDSDGEDTEPYWSP